MGVTLRTHDSDFFSPTSSYQAIEVGEEKKETGDRAMMGYFRAIFCGAGGGGSTFHMPRTEHI